MYNYSHKYKALLKFKNMARNKQFLKYKTLYHLNQDFLKETRHPLNYSNMKILIRMILQTHIEVSLPRQNQTQMKTLETITIMVIAYSTNQSKGNYLIGWISGPPPTMQQMTDRAMNP